MIMNILSYSMSLLMQINCDRFWIKKIHLKFKKKKRKFSNIIRILISIIMIISNYKIKIKINKTLIKIFIKTLSKIFDENYVTLNDFSDKTEVNQNLIFSSVNMIIAEKMIFILNAVFQIIQLETVNSLLISIKCL